MCVMSIIKQANAYCSKTWERQYEYGGDEDTGDNTQDQGVRYKIIV